MHLCRSVANIPKDPGALAAALQSRFTRLLEPVSLRGRNQAKLWGPCIARQSFSPALLPLAQQRALTMDASSSAPPDKEQTPSAHKEAATAAAMDPPAAAAATTATEGAAAAGALKRKAEKEVGRKQKKCGGDPKKIRTSQLIGEIAQHAKHNRLQPAMAAFRAAVDEGLKLGSSMFNTLLYLSCGGNNWEAYARGQPVPQTGSSDPIPTKEELVESTHTLWTHMQREGMQAEHATYLSLARIEAIKGNAAGALSWAKTCVAADQAVQLRLFHPALVSLMLRGDVQCMLEVDQLIASFCKEQLDLTEYEYAVLLEGLTQHGSWTQVADLLHRVGKELNQLSPSTVGILEAYFSGPRSAEAFDASSQEQREAAEQRKEARLLRVRQQQQQEAREQRQLATERLKLLQQKQAAWREARQGGPRVAQAREEQAAQASAAPAAHPSPPPRHPVGSPTDTPMPEAESAGVQIELAPGPSSVNGSSAAAAPPSPAPRSPRTSAASAAAPSSPAPKSPKTSAAAAAALPSPAPKSPKASAAAAAASPAPKSPRTSAAAAAAPPSPAPQSPKASAAAAAAPPSPAPQSPKASAAAAAAPPSPAPQSPKASAAAAAAPPSPAPQSPKTSAAAAAALPSPAPQSPEASAAAALPEEEKRRRRPWLGYGGAKSWQVSSNVAMDASSNSLTAAALKPLVVDLEEEEWASFSAGVAALAMRLEQRESDFQHYMDWYQRNGPYDILIDGANVAFYGQNREGGGFNWKQVMSMVQLVQQQYPDKKVLLMLHYKRVTDSSANSPRVARFLDGLRASKSFYATPVGSNDDWYWLYATIQARSGGLLISNDELRDHIWSLLRPKHFLKWKSRHIAHYTFVASDNGSTWVPALTLPNAFTECVQELEDGSWVFPCTDKTWLCASPAAV